jgi:hypothetical protein
LLATAPWHALRFLDLHGNKLGDKGVSEIATSPHLRALERVDVRDNALGAAVSAAAKAWFWEVPR